MNLKKILKQVLTNKTLRSQAALPAFVLATIVVAEPWY